MRQLIQREKEGITKPTRSYSSKQEKHIASELGGATTFNSGATPFDKGDVKLEDWLIEAKTCAKEKESFSIKKAWLEKNEKEALFMGKPYSALVFNFGPGTDNYYIIDEKLMKNIIENYCNI